MVAYLKEMADVSMAVAEGDLTVEVVPPQARYSGNAFLRMFPRLARAGPHYTRSAGQVSAAPSVAGAADESAKVSVQASPPSKELPAPWQRR